MLQDIKGYIESHIGKKYGVEPIGYVLTGSKAYGIDSPTSDFDVIGVHISKEILEHPKHRKPWEVLSEQPAKDLSIVSYEAWKYIEMLQNGAFTAYEIRVLPQIPGLLSGWWEIWQKLRQEIAIPTGCFYSALGNFKSDTLPKIKKGERKGALMGYYRLIQARMALTTNQYQCNAWCLFNWYNDNVHHIKGGLKLLDDHMDPELRGKPLADTSFIDELHFMEKSLLEEVRKQDARSYPQDSLEGMLKALKRDRICLIKEENK